MKTKQIEQHGYGGGVWEYSFTGMTIRKHHKLTRAEKSSIGRNVARTEAAHRAADRRLFSARDCARRYLAWCEENNVTPTLDWRPSVITEIGAARIELIGDCGARLEHWLMLCKRTPPQEKR